MKARRRATADSAAAGWVGGWQDKVYFSRRPSTSSILVPSSAMRACKTKLKVGIRQRVWQAAVAAAADAKGLTV
jgi:hypothetical protein